MGSCSIFCVLFLMLQGALALPENIVLQYVQSLGKGDLTNASMLLDNNASLIWKGDPRIFSFGGEWTGKNRVLQFYSRLDEIFDASKFLIDNVATVTTEGSIVVVQYTEFRTALATRHLCVLNNTAIFFVNNNDLITKIEVFLDTSTVLASITCGMSPMLYCGANGPVGTPRSSDSRPQKPAPSLLNSDVNVNRDMVSNYLAQLKVGNFTEAFSFLSQNVSLTWQGSVFSFPTLSGTWSGKARVKQFFANVGNLFDMTKFSFDDVSIIAASNNTVLVQFVEHNTASQTGRSYNEINSVLYTFGDYGVIEDIEIWLDTAGVLDVTLCDNGRVGNFTCSPVRPPRSTRVIGYLQAVGSGNLTKAAEYLGDAVGLTYKAPLSLFPTLGGVWVSKKEVMRWYENMGLVFDRKTMLLRDINVLATQDSMVVVQYIELATSIQTKRSYQLEITAVFNIDDTITNINMVVDTATVFSTMSCTGPLLHCGTNRPIGTPRVSDPKRSRPPPTSANSNITLNRKAVDRYLDLLGLKDFEGSLTLLSETASLSWEGSSVLFPTLGGVWRGKQRIREFHSAFAGLFDLHNFSFDEINIVAAENNIVVADYYEHNKALKTNRSYHEINTLVFTFVDGGVIEDIEMWVNTAAVLDAILCKGSNITCASSVAPADSPPNSPSRAWVGWIVGILVVAFLAAGGYSYFRFRQRAKVQSTLHETLLTPIGPVE